MDWLLTPLSFVWPFLLVLTPLVFFHELGHYWVARWCGVKIDVFSIGFGPEIFGWNDGSGTRWKLCWIPLGGYVKMHGDEDVSSRPVAKSSPKVDTSTMQDKTPLQRIAISLAGPFANYVLAVICFFVVFMVRGLETYDSVILEPVPDSPAAKAGLRLEDKILSINGRATRDFGDVVSAIQALKGEDLTVTVTREGVSRSFEIGREAIAGYGDRLGIGPARSHFEHVGVLKAFGAAFDRVVFISVHMLSHLWGVLTQKISSKEMGSVLMVAKMASDVSRAGAISLLLFLAVLSVNLGLINLLPIPMLDGGHIPFYLYEMVTGKPLPEWVIEWLYRFGLAIIIGLFLLATWNDTQRLGIVAFVKGLFS
jgi:regulator of sigma E protease